MRYIRLEKATTKYIDGRNIVHEQLKAMLEEQNSIANKGLLRKECK